MSSLQQVLRTVVRPLVRASSTSARTQTKEDSSSGYCFALNETQIEVQNVARKFAREEVLPTASHYDKTGEFPWPIFKKAWELGLTNGHIPAELGGLEQTVFDGCLIAEEISYACSGIQVAIEGTNLGQSPVILAGNTEQKKKYLGRLIDEPLIASTLRRAVMYVYRQKINKLLADIYYVFWPSNFNGLDQHKLLQKESRYLMTYVIAYSLSALTATTLYIIPPLSKLETPYMTHYPFHWRKNPYYSLLYAWEGFCFIETCGSICGWNVFFASLTFNCVAQFKLLSTYIKENFQNLGNNVSEQKKFIRKCILHHYEILRMSEELNQIFYYFTLSLFVISIQTCCLSAFVMTAVPELSLFGLTYFCGHTCQLFLYCYLGNELALESMELATSIYVSGWEMCGKDKDLQRTLMMIMVRAKNPVRISAGGFGYLQLSSFMKILQFSFSIYTLLNTMVKKGRL